MPEENEFYDWLSATARGHGYASDAALAEALELQQSTVSRWRKGTRPHITHLVKLGRLFRMSIEPMLVLTGHVPHDLLGNAEPPAPPTSPTVREIQEAPLPDNIKGVLLQYWDQRLNEEQARVGELLEVFKSADGSALTPAATADAFALASSDLPQHFADAMREAAHVLESVGRRTRRTGVTR
ncbi:helix-turn-helix transcriptional regulator [Nonomuraea sp. NPDC050680]|uniref:helix-turn-helix transcriptional regulator n=1 Tax=Nonomuraea sp. NPDC050680 TaxID=3154630 RepID=UPI0033CAA594